MEKTAKILVVVKQKDYELIDSGEGEKLERLGNIIVARPDPQALWEKLSLVSWKNRDAAYVRTGPKTGKWEYNKKISEKWNIEVEGLVFGIRLTPFKHTGVFPEQAPNWTWLKETIQESKDDVRVLNLFGYTGGASIACVQAGAQVTHVDSSKTAVTWANENVEANGITNKPIRWILEDAYAFVKKELKRDRSYEGIIMDPPTFGHGTKGELWKIEKQFTSFVYDCIGLLSEKPSFFLINGYAAGYSSIAYANNLQALLKRFGGVVEYGELAIEESVGKRLLPAGIFARWKP